MHMPIVARVRVVAAICLFPAALILVGGCASRAKGNLRPFVGPTSDPPTSAAAHPEVRAMWVTTANNIDWPSKPALHRRVQKDEINAIVARAKELKCNLILLQVRGFGDRIYRRTELALDSGGKYDKEPWSQSLNYDFDPDKTGNYDPFDEWLNACNSAGIELHAWINPFRVNKLVTVHIARKDYWLPVVLWEKQLYLDPRSSEVQAYVRAVINDFLHQYPPEQNKFVGAIQASDPGRAMMLMPGDGPEGVVYDHQIPPDDHRGTTRPSGRAIDWPDALPAALLAAEAPPPSAHASVPVVTLDTPAQKRADWLFRLYKKTTAKHITTDTFNETTETFLTWSYDKVSAENGLFGLSPNADVNDPENYAVPQLKNKKLDYVIPELYADLTPTQFRTALKSWLDAVPPDPDPTRVIAGLNSARVQTPATVNDEATWPPEKIDVQVGDARTTTGENGRSAAGAAHFSMGALREAHQGGPPEERNLGKQLKAGNYHSYKLSPPPRRAINNPPGAPRNFNLDPRPDGEYVTWMKGQGRRPRRWEVWLWRPSGWDDVIIVGEAERMTNRGEVKIDSTVTDVWVKAVDKFNYESATYGKWHR